MNIKELMEFNKQSVEKGISIFPELLVENDKGEKDMLVLGFLEEMNKRGIQMFAIGKKYRSENPGMRIKSVVLTSTVKATDIRKKDIYKALMVVQKNIEIGNTSMVMQKFHMNKKDNKIEWIGEIDFSEDIQANIIDKFLEGFNSYE